MDVILDRLQLIIDQLKALNGKVADHEKWIQQRDWAIDATEDRLKALEQTADSHQSYIDRRANALVEFEAMKKQVAGHERWITLKDGGAAAIAKLVMELTAFAGILATAIKVIFFPGAH